MKPFDLPVGQLISKARCRASTAVLAALMLNSSSFSGGTAVPPPLPELSIQAVPASGSVQLFWDDPAAPASNGGTNFVLETSGPDGAPPYWTPVPSASPPQPWDTRGENSRLYRLRWSDYWRAQLDTDGDGMSDLIEEGNPQFLSPENPLDADGDWDRDGVSNRDEILAGTDPDDFNGQLGFVDGSFLAVKKDQSFWAWGANPGGRLGNGLIVDPVEPAPMGLAQLWRFVAASPVHGLALDRDGFLWAWGDNSVGELGDPSLGHAQGNFQTNQSAPARVGAAHWSTVTAGRTFRGGFSIGIQKDGTMWQWGADFQGFNGSPVPNPPAAAVQVGTNRNWRTAAAGLEHAVAIRADGTLWQWGLNYLGSFGSDLPFNTVYAGPIQVGTNATWRHATAGANYNLAIRQDGTLWGWGSLAPALHVGTPSIPTELGHGWRWRSAVLQDNALIAIQDDGTLWAWGELPRSSGQTWLTDLPQPVAPGRHWHTLVSEMPSVLSPSSRTLARADDGTLWLFSRGMDQPAIRTRPGRVGTDSDWQSVSAGDGWSMGRRTDGSLWSWGSAPYFPTNAVTSGSPAVIRPIEPGTRWASAAAGVVRGFGIQSDGTLWQWGRSFRYFGGAWVVPPQIGGGNEHGGGTPVWMPAQSPPPVFVPQPFGPAAMWIDFQQGRDHGLGLQTDGSLWEWGLFPRPLQDTVATRAAANVAQQVGDGHHWVKIRTGANHNLAVDQNGALYGWGYNESGQVGDGSLADRMVPVPLTDGSAWRDMAAGDHHSLGITTDGTLWAWGDNSRGQLGGISSTNSMAPVAVPTGQHWLRVFAGGDSSFAMADDGSLWAWGDNLEGQLGLGDTSSHAVPQRVGISKGWRDLSVSRHHTLAIRENGSLWSWGANPFGQLADDSPSLPMTLVNAATDW